jgi:phage terminase large subunit
MISNLTEEFIRPTMTDHVYSPYGAAQEIMRIRDTEVVLSGPAGTGKSRACLEKLLITGSLTPGVRMLVIRKTQASLASTGLVTWREHVAKEAIETGFIRYYGGSSVEPAAYIWKNGSVLVVGGMDRATKIMSSEYDIIYVQEATELTVTEWEHLLTRLRNHRITFQQLIADCNPGPPHHWLKTRSDTGTVKMVHCKHSDNPILVDQTTMQPTPTGVSYFKVLNQLSGVRRARLRDGIWAAAEGLVYERWDPTTHMIDNTRVPEAWPRYWSIDFGFVHPMVIQFWALSPTDRLVMYREIYRTGRTPDQHAHEIMGIVRRPDGTWIEPRPRAIICDHDASDRMLIERVTGMKTVPARKSVMTGINLVTSRIVTASGDSFPRTIMMPRIQIMRDALVSMDKSLMDRGVPTCTADEITSYVWPDKTGPKEAPVKENDHGMDAMRYMVAHLDWDGPRKPTQIRIMN